MSRAGVSEAADLIVGMQEPTHALVYVVSDRAGEYLSDVVQQLVTKASTLEVFGNISEFIDSLPEVFVVLHSHASYVSSVLH